MERVERRLQVGPTVAIVGTVLAAACSGGLLAVPGRQWYRELDKPKWQPPAAVFAPIWTTLYILAGASPVVAWHTTPPPERRSLFTIFGLNAVLNASWTGCFFRARRPWLATADSAALLGTTVALIARTRHHSGFASTALMPYAAWTAFATALSGEIARRNR